MERLIGFDPQLLADAAITGINIFILFFVLSYLLFNPVRDVLKKRQERIAGELLDASTKQETATKLKEEYEEKIRTINAQAEDIIEEARKQAKKRETEIVNEAKAEAVRIIDRANHEIDLEKKKAIDDLKGDMISIAAMLAKKAVGTSINVDIQDQLVDETLKEMGESTWQS